MRWLKKIDWDFLVYYAIGLSAAWGAWINYTEGKGTAIFGLFTALVFIIAAESGRIRKAIREADRGEPEA